MNPRRIAFFALIVAFLLTLSGSFGVLSFSASYYPAQSELAATVSTPISTGLNESSATIPISLPPQISIGGAQGSILPTTPMSLSVVISSRNPLGLEQYVNEVNTPSSQEYGQYLTPQKYAELYGPDLGEISSLSSYFEAKGLQAEIDASDPSILHVSGNALQVESAFQISLDSFKVSNQSFYSPLTMPKLPSEFSFVQTVYGLSNYEGQSGFNASPMYKTFGMISGKPGQADSNNIYYVPSEMYQIYNSSSLMRAGYNGTGVTIAVIDAYGDPYIQQELDNFSSQFGLPQLTINQICVDGPCNYASGVSQGWQPEIALDVEWVHAMAPGAAINLYIGSNSSFPLFDAVEEAVSNSSNSIITMSWGSPENSMAASSPIAPIEGNSYPWLDQVLQQAAAEGITAFTSSGDYGAYDEGALGESLPYGGASYPSTDPYVTSVGGTTLYMNTTSGTLQFPYSNATGSYGYETAWSWNNAYGWGTGGGYSTLFAAPPWQHGPGIDPSVGTRGAPDVAWDADPATGVAIALYDPALGGVQYFVEGGTSVGSPSWAGSMATIEQKAGHKLGLITPELYSILNNPAEYAKAFHDITVGNNNPNSANAGWNPLTGIGSPNLGELANYLAPSGSLDVAVTNSLTGQFAASFAYGSQIDFAANVTSGGLPVSTGTVVANITGPSGQTIAKSVPFSFSSVIGEWTGSYSIKSTDPPGMWTATVSAGNGVLSGWGINTFSVGDGVNIFLPVFNVTTLAAAVPKFTIGQTINITAEITSPSGACCVTSGNYDATFNENSPSGKSEGSVPLSYNSTTGMWEGQFKIPPTIDQDSWALTVSGTDSDGNSGSTYTWLYVGLNVLLQTDSPTYVLGDVMTIKATPEYSNGLEASTGAFTATVSQGSKIIASLPLALNPTEGVWMAQLPLGSSSPTGFYQITVSGNDGHGSAGTAGTVVRVAPYTINGTVSIPSPSISVNGGSEPMISARMTYPNGSLMTQGSVNAFVYIDHEGLHFPLSLIRMTFDPSTGSFYAPYLLGPSSPANTSIGSYLVSVQAFDPEGNYANLTSSFFVSGLTHAPITISDNSQFTAANGVLQGNGTALNPYVFAGWNTSSVSISGGATDVYDFINDWVSGSTGNGIYLNTPAAAGSLLEDVFSVNNAGNGINVNDVPGITMIADVTSHNAGSGVVITNDTGTLPPDVALSVSNGNGLNGFTVENAKSAEVSRNSAADNSEFGFYLDNLLDGSFELDNATGNRVGAYITGVQNQTYGVDDFLYAYLVDNNLGLEINGLDQNITSANNSTGSFVLAYYNLIENNSVAVLAANNSQVQLYGNTIGFNERGVVLENSVPVVVDNIISQNNESAVDISGGFPGQGGCLVSFPNSTILLYSSCISGNFVSLNGNSTSSGIAGIEESNLNGSLIYSNLDSNNKADGLDLSNVTGSAISLNSFNNDSGYGIHGISVTKTGLVANNMSNDDFGVYLGIGGSNYVDRNNLSDDSINGISLNNSANNTITKNLISSVGSACATETSCTFSGGVDLSNGSSLNSVTYNSISNVTASGKIGAGIVLQGSAAQNLIFQNNVTNNDAGILISESPSNTISNNNLSSNKYGVYLVGQSNIDLASNTLTGDGQDLYPNLPSVSFTGIRNGTSISGIVKISWNSTGQAISNQTLEIDGTAQAVSGTSYSWNSTALSDGIHVLTIRVTNGAGENASASLIVSTTNHEFLTVETIGPENVPISNSVITLDNSTFSANATTDSSGRALFHGLSAGLYNASTSINGTGLISPVSYNANSTVILFVPTLITSAQALRPNGVSVPIQVSGNLTSSQMSDVLLENANQSGGYVLSFDLSGASNTGVLATISIPKSSTSAGLVPEVSINGLKSENQSYSQDSSYYYVMFPANFANGTQKVSIQLSPSAPAFNIKYVVLIVVLLAIIVAGIVLALRRGSRKNYYLPSQQN